MHWKVALVKLKALHEARMMMSHASLYHGPYVEEAIKLNSILYNATGKQYTDYSQEEIESFTFEKEIMGL